MAVPKCGFTLLLIRYDNLSRNTRFGTYAELQAKTWGTEWEKLGMKAKQAVAVRVTPCAPLPSRGF